MVRRGSLKPLVSPPGEPERYPSVLASSGPTSSSSSPSTGVVPPTRVTQARTDRSADNCCAPEERLTCCLTCISACWTTELPGVETMTAACRISSIIATTTPSECAAPCGATASCGCTASESTAMGTSACSALPTAGAACSSGRGAGTAGLRSSSCSMGIVVEVGGSCWTDVPGTFWEWRGGMGVV